MIIYQLIFILYLHIHIHHINHHHVTHQLIFLHHLHPRIRHLNHHHIVHQLIFSNHHYYTPLYPSTNLQLVKRPPILRSDIESFIQGIRSRVRYAVSSLTTEAARTLEHL